MTFNDMLSPDCIIISVLLVVSEQQLDASLWEACSSIKGIMPFHHRVCQWINLTHIEQAGFHMTAGGKQPASG